MRSLATEFGESTNCIRIELNRLAEAGLLSSEESGNKIKYKANEAHPLFPEIRSIVGKYLGLDQLLEKVIHKLGDLKHAYIVGDYAQGVDSGIIELVLVGNLDQEYVHLLLRKAEEIIHRKCQLILINEDQFESLRDKLKLADGILLWSSN